MRLFLFLFLPFSLSAQTQEVEPPAKSINERSSLAEMPGIFCAVVRPESFPGAKDAVVVVYTEALQPPFRCTWASPAGGGSLSNIQCRPFRISGLTSGPAATGNTYTINCTGAGNVTGTCSFQIVLGNPPRPVNCSIFETEDCRQHLLNRLQTALVPPASALCRQWKGGAACSETDHLYRDGQVGIGTSNVPSGFRLAVKGNIVTNGVMINLCKGSWCDYVFDKNYPLLSLPAMETYIKKEKSLPNTHTQSQVTADGGYEVRSVLLEQQEKIEEAFLHLIALEEKVAQLRVRNAKLKAENEQLEKNNSGVPRSHQH